MSHAAPIVFDDDDDIPVRESLDALICCTGWQPENFASAQQFLTRPCAQLQARIAADGIDMPIHLHHRYRFRWRRRHE